MSTAPVCHIPPVTPSTQPGPTPIPAIPPAQATIASLQNTVNQMRIVVMYLAGQMAQAGPQGKPGNDAKAKPARWTEANRTVETVRIFSPTDKSVFVDVEQINKLVMKDGVTGESWTWDRDRK